MYRRSVHQCRQQMALGPVQAGSHVGLLRFRGGGGFGGGGGGGGIRQGPPGLTLAPTTHGQQHAFPELHTTAVAEPEGEQEQSLSTLPGLPKPRLQLLSKLLKIVPGTARQGCVSHGVFHFVTGD